MRYPIAIELGDETQAFGVVVPDLPGCLNTNKVAMPALLGLILGETDEYANPV